MTASAADLAPYVARRVFARLAGASAASPEGSGNPAVGDVEEIEAAVLLADVSGSVRLAERYAAQGREGAERFSALMGVYFGGIVDAVHEAGGDVLQFTGDGLLAIWPAVRSAGEGVAQARARACAAALACAGRMQSQLLELSRREPALPDGRIGLGAGRGRFLTLSDAEHRSECVLVGAVVREAAAAEKASAAGSHTVGTTFSEWLGGDSIEGIASTVAPASAEAEPASACSPAAMFDGRSEAARLLARHVPLAVRARAGDGGDEWLAELRRVSTLFVRIGDAEDAPPGQIAAASREVFGIVHAMEGDIARVGAQGGGIAVLVAFGLPPRAHADDADRAVIAALRVTQQLASGPLPVRVGVSTGLLFCGPVGTATRREYALLGDSVNLAARLAEVAEDGVLCEATTRQACRRPMDFGERLSLEIRGKSAVVEAYRPRARVEEKETTDKAMVGRENERAALEVALERAARSGQGGRIFLEGEAGIGKTSVVAGFLRRAEALGHPVAVAGGDAIEKQSPYHVWRGLLQRRLRWQAAAGEFGAEAAVKRIAESLVERTGLGEDEATAHAPWIATALGLPDSPEVAALAAEARAERVAAAIARILGDGGLPPLLVVEDAHWLDSASASVLSVLARRADSTLLVVTARPGEAPMVEELLRDLPRFARLRVGALGDEAVEELLRLRLGVEEVPAPLLRFLLERAAGHPLFTEELLNLLVTEGTVSVEAGLCRFDRDAGAGAGALPATVEDVVRSRIDGLGVAARRVLKLAAVWGGSFEPRDLFRMRESDDPSGDEEKTALRDPLATLVEAGLLVHASAGEEAYAFRHAILRSVAYEAIPFALRRRLHRQAADSLATTGDRAPALEAFHLALAIDPQVPDFDLVRRAIAAQQAAGEVAAAAFANDEVIALFRGALELARLGPDLAAEASLAHWHRRVGEASYRLGRAQAAMDHLLESLRLSGRPMPATTPRLLLELLRATGVELGRRIRPRGAFPPSAVMPSVVGPAPALRERAATSELLAFVSMLRSADLTTLVANLRAVDDARASGPCAEFASAAALLGVGIGGIFGARAAEWYFARASEAATASGDRGAYGKVHLMRAFVLLGATRWDDAVAALEEARRAYDEVGDARWHETVFLHLGNVFTLNHEFASGDAPYRSADQRAFARGDVQVQAWAHVGMSHSELCRGRLESALVMHAKVRAWTGQGFERLADRASALGVLGMEAEALVQLGRFEEARRRLVEARDRLGSIVLLYHASTGYTHLADAALRLLEREQERGLRDPELEAMASLFCRTLARFARSLPIGRPQALVLGGLLLHLRGRRSAAAKQWRLAIVEAKRRRMPRDEGVAHYELGRHLAESDPRRMEELGLAREIFERIGASHWAMLARAAGGEGGEPEGPGGRRDRTGVAAAGPGGGVAVAEAGDRAARPAVS